MALTTQTVNDTLYYPDGTPMAGAFITFTLVGTGTSPEDSGTVPPSTYTETTSSGGFFSVNLWPNVLGYAGTNYKVEVSYTDTTTGKYVTKKVGTIQVPDVAGPHDLSELLEQNVVAGGTFYLGVITQEQYDTVLNVQANADIATLAAIAAGAPLVTELTSPVPADDTVELLQTTSGTQVWEVQTGTWVQIGWLGTPVFPTIAAMALAEGMIDGQYADVEDGFNGEKERFQYDSGGTLTADGAFVVDGVGGQWVSKRRDVTDVEIDPRGYESLSSGNVLNSGYKSYTVKPEGTPFSSPYVQTAGNAVLQVLPDGRSAYITSSFGKGNLSDQFSRALDAVQNDRTIPQGTSFVNDTAGIIIPPGVYDLDAPLVVEGLAGFNLYAFGAVVQNLTDSFTPFKITTSAHATINGLGINMRNNNLANEAFHVAGSNSYLTVNHLRVQANSSNTNFAGVRMQQGNASGLLDDNRDAGNFWAEFNRYTVSKLSGGDANTIAMGMDVQGAQNALRINSSQFGNVATGILLRNQNSSLLSGTLNDFQIFQVAFEAFTTGVKFQMDGGATQGFGGGSAIQCRFENGTTGFESATTNQPVAPLSVIAPTQISDVPDLVVDARSSKDTFNVIGGGITPSREQRFGGNGMAFFQNVEGATGRPAIAAGSRQVSQGGSYQVRRNDGTVDGRISQRPGGGMDVDGAGVGLGLANLKSLSSTNTQAKNFTGTAGLAGGATTLDITIAAEPDASYGVFAEFQHNNGGYWVTNKTTTGFRINMATSTAGATSVRWMLIR